MEGKPLITLSKRWREEPGVTLIETMIAGAILMIVVAGLLPLFTTAIIQNEQQGDVATRTTEYARDKMEQLMELDFDDGTTDTTISPANPTGCTGTGTNICGLGGTMAANSSAGALQPAAADTGYVDYLDMNGYLLTGSTGAFYTRQWSILTDPTATWKTITVTVTFRALGSQQGVLQSTTVGSIKSSGL